MGFQINENGTLEKYTDEPGVTEVIIPDGVTEIGEGAFSYSVLTSVSIPESVTEIGDGAFDHCCGLTEIVIPNGVIRIGMLAFNQCSALTSVSIPESVTEIGDRAFYGCSNITSITIPDNGIELGTDVFEGCDGLAGVLFPDYSQDDPNRLTDVAYLKYVANECLDNPWNVDDGAAYRYGQMLYTGTEDVPQDEEQAMCLWAKMFENEYYEFDHPLKGWDPEYCDYVRESTVEYFAAHSDIFLAAEWYQCHLQPRNHFLEMLWYIQKGIPGALEADPERAFRLARRVRNAPAKNGGSSFVLLGGLDLVEWLRFIDEKNLFVGDCFLKGEGTDRDLCEAYFCYSKYRTDHLMQKWFDVKCDRFEPLYQALKKAHGVPDENEARHCYVLALMTMEGLGCTADPVKAKEYLKKARELAGTKDTDEPEDDLIDRLSGLWEEEDTECDAEQLIKKIKKVAKVEDKQVLSKLEDMMDEAYLDRLISFGAKPYCPGDIPAPGEHIYLGKYNNRSVSWKVLDVKQEEILLLADEVLDDSRNLTATQPDQKEEGWDMWAQTFAVRFSTGLDDCLTGGPFLMTEKDVRKYLPDSEDRICYYRDQALRNASNDEDSGNHEPASWLLSPFENWAHNTGELFKMRLNHIKVERNYRSVDIDGEILEEGGFLGIRPAMYLFPNAVTCEDEEE